MQLKTIAFTAAILYGSFTPFVAIAQTEPNPNQDRFLQSPENEVPELLEEEDAPSLIPDDSATENNNLSENQTPITVSEIKVVGSTVFTDADFAVITDPILGDSTIGALNQAVEQITQLYIGNGYLTSNAILPTQQLNDGVVTIEVIEGTLESITVNGLNNLNESYVTSRVGLGVDTPLNINDLEEQLRLLQIDQNLTDLDVNLQSGSGIGESTLQLDVEERKSFFGNVFVDNYSPVSIGDVRGGINLGYRNLIGVGDVLNVGYTQTFEDGLDLWEFGYRIPLNAMDGTLAFSASIDRNEIVAEPFNSLNIRGESETYRLSFRQPLKRTIREEFALSLGFNYRDGQTFVFDNVGQAFSAGADADGSTRTSVFRFGQDYTRRDTKGTWSLRSQFSLGTGLFNATSNSDPIPDGQFLSWLGQVVRVHRLNDRHTLIVRGDLQLSGDNLLSSEGFSLGGAQTLRGYRQGARNADNGWRFSIEDRITLAQNEDTGQLIQIAPFFDYGVVWNNADNTSQIANEHTLAGLGTAFIIKPVQDLTLRLDFAIPLVDTGDRQNNIQDDGMYFSLDYAF
ncbi:Polypeptide-transport-associated domain protein ShlB-type [[Leptolyngbya] sp. PCC 7376]|uniref:ShlB/FhaC/HecB family hemolysin secretion/activation protein n=1 Tax=[Leptolyngbya] sp. PCC 7376 TaxID=111781 RepID=UPI00029F0302|nr:ShlB/FhaC/HecB family hemolysin secretion/activation protein [[Leptolyngbya] sp. PCC 7376]AFY37650.1 Polypeptide-transport-associated domain protein ShlB-type [[Leptolyngbya] sp. PCC 7376]